MENPFINLDDLETRAEHAERVAWQGREALRLENGLALVPGDVMQNISIEVLIGTDGPAYPGVAFRVADVHNFELAYAVPHVSGQWDALQYDPVFRGSNTWQIYHGPSYQHETQVPTGRWFRLRVECCDNRAAVSVDGQSPLLVEQLAHAPASGRCGLWTFRPAYFCDLRIAPCATLTLPKGTMPSIAAGVVESWFIEGYRVADCEPNGVLNLCRYITPSLEKARLTRRFTISEAGEVTLSLGFSDVLVLEVDGDVVYEGEHKFAGFANRASRGYVELGQAAVTQVLPSGEHLIVAELAMREGFGWGLILAAHGPGLRWLPADLG